MRQIWSEIRDSTERGKYESIAPPPYVLSIPNLTRIKTEAQSHSAFRDSMNTDVITPTLQLKVYLSLL